MEIPEVTVIAKIGLQNKPGESPVYSFRLSGATDPPWRLLLGAVYPDAPIKIHGDNLDITCQPEEIVEIYDRTKKALGVANRLYQAAKPKILEIARKQDEDRLRLQDDKEAEAKRISDPFEDLQL